MGVLFHSWNLAVGKQRKTSIWPIALMYYYRRSAVFLQGFLYHTIKNRYMHSVFCFLLWILLFCYREHRICKVRKQAVLSRLLRLFFILKRITFSYNAFPCFLSILHHGFCHFSRPPASGYNPIRINCSSGQSFSIIIFFIRAAIRLSSSIFFSGCSSSGSDSRQNSMVG